MKHFGTLKEDTNYWGISVFLIIVGVSFLFGMLAERFSYKRTRKKYSTEVSVSP